MPPLTLPLVILSVVSASRSEALTKSKELCTLRGVPFRAEIAPSGILRDDQGDFLDSQPTFNLLLLGDGIVYILKALKVDQSVQLVLKAESGSDAPFVFPLGVASYW
jgi:hypothetical protein